MQLRSFLNGGWPASAPWAAFCSRGRCLAVISIIATASCSSRPSAPSPTEAAERATASPDRQVGAAAITTERIQLRRSGGSAIITPQLTSGQVLDVPLNVELDVWGEIRRLETDRARLFVNWGNGNDDFTGCGSCRLTNTYTREGRYTLTARVVDLNAPTDSAPIASVSVTLNVIDLAKAERLTCAPVSQDFEAYPRFTPLPISSPGLTVSAPSSGRLNVTGSPAWEPELKNQIVQLSSSTVVLTFDSDKTALSLGAGAAVGGDVLGFTAYDSGGTMVASGTLALTPALFGISKGSVNIEAPAFRRVVLQAFGGPLPSPPLRVDNIRATCS